MHPSMRKLQSLAVALLVLAACRRKIDEPDPSKGAPSSHASGSSFAPAPSASGPDEYAPFGPKEFKEFETKIGHEECEEAAKKKNQLEGLADYDKKGTLLLSACLMLGNLAWYRCVLTADTADHFGWCSRRYLIPPNEVKLKK